MNYSFFKKVIYEKFSLFKITQDYIIILLKVIRRKQTSKINQTSSCKHKINESNTELSAYY